MITPRVPDILSVVIETIDRDIAPSVSSDDDGYAQSLCRTVGQMLRMVRARVEHEEGALTEDNDELRALLREYLPTVSGDVRADVDAVLFAAADGEAKNAVDRLTQEATRLRTALTLLIPAFPDATSPFRSAVRHYLSRHLDRQSPWLTDAFTGPRR